MSKREQIERQLAMERTAYQVAIKEARRLNDENLILRRTVERLRKALRGMIEAVEGERMRNAIQRGKDLL